MFKSERKKPEASEDGKSDNGAVESRIFPSPATREIKTRRDRPNCETPPRGRP